MKPFAGFKSEASNNKKTASLPNGAYVAKIKAVKVDGVEPDQWLVIRLDVIEGEYTDYFINRFNREAKNSKFDPKYRGDFRLRIPNDDNTNAMYPESDLRNFNDAMYRIESSNPGYTWDWNEHGLVGKIVGINMQDDEWNEHVFTKIGRLEIADDVRKGIVNPMEPTKRYKAWLEAQKGTAPAGMTKVDEELPWDDGKPKAATDNPWF